MIKFKRLLKSFNYSFRGLYKVLKEEQNMRIQLLAAIIVVALAIFFHIKAVEWLILIVLMSMVFLAEVINSAVERITDVLRPRINDYVKEIKDIMAAAVMITAITSIIAGIIIFYPYFAAFLQ